MFLPVVLLCGRGLLHQAGDEHRVMGVNVRTAVFHWVIVENRDYKGKEKNNFFSKCLSVI